MKDGVYAVCPYFLFKFCINFMAFIFFYYLGSMYSEDYESNNFDQYVTRDDTRLPEGGTTLETHTKQHFPSSTPTSPTTNNRTIPRPCDKRVDLYILQPDRLNTSGQFNPLKGKLTNCHITGCERWVYSMAARELLQWGSQ